jgi:phosphoribosylformimino-5-aminoimidazole carboxamide ribotide isomerase
MTNGAVIEIIPAIDIKGGRCVRLQQGRAEDETVYSLDPVEMAMHWVAQGATWLHVVDLDGAFHGCPVHLNVVGAIASKAGIPVELGGGLRTDDDIRRALEAGVQRAIIGTRVFETPQAMAALVEQFGRRLAVGIDARDGLVQVRGWVETTGRRAVDLAEEADRAGVETLIYTDTSRDGMLGGVNAAAMDEMCRHVRCQVIASGGISRAEDVKALRRLGRGNLKGAIVGKALYEHRATMAELTAAGR